MTKKLIIDARMLAASGIGRYIAEILPRIKSEYDLLCLINEADKDFFIKNAINYQIFNAKFYSIKEQLQFSKYQNKNAIFWSPHFNVPILPFRCKKRIVTIHDVFHLAYYEQLSFVQKLYAKLCINSALRKSDKAITVSEFSKNEILKYTSATNAKKLFVIHNGVSFKFNTIDDHQKSKTLDSKYFLFVGNIKPHKNLKNAIFAFQKLQKEEPKLTKDLEFRIIGKKEGFITGDTELMSLIENDQILRKFIKFTGYVSDTDLKELYLNAQCLVFPSFYEGFGLPPLEAMANGCPTIVSNTSSMPEVCGDATLYFDPFNVDDMKDKMRQILKSESLRKNLIDKGYDQIQKFTWDFSAQQHKKLIDSLY